MRGRVRKLAFEEEHKFRPTPRGTNLYVGSKIPHFNPLDESLIGTGTDQGKLLSKILSCKEIHVLEAFSWLEDSKTRNLMILFMDRLNPATLSYIARKEYYPLPARLKAIELLSDNFDAICDVRNGLAYEIQTDNMLKVHESVIEKWQNLREQGHLVANPL